MVLAVKIIQPLLLGIVGLAPIGDLFEIITDPGLFHRLMFVAAPSGGDQDIFESRRLGLAQRFFDAGNEIRGIDVETMPARDLKRIFPNLGALGFVKGQVVILFKLAPENMWDEKQIKRAISDLSELLN